MQENTGNSFFSVIDRFHNLVLFSLIAFIVALDQLTKIVIKKYMYLYESFGVVGNFFKLTYIENPGMAFGIQWENKVLFTVLSVVAAVVVLMYLLKMRTERFSIQLALASILGGAVGNLIDRLLYGKVVDFLDFEFFDVNIPSFQFLVFNFPGYEMHRWPVFNVADMAVSCGMIIITFLILFPSLAIKREVSTQT